MIQSLQDLPKDIPFKVGFSRKTDGNMSFRLGKDAATVKQDRINFFQGEGILPEEMVTFFTEHKDDITIMAERPQDLDAMKGERLAITDAIISLMPKAGVFLTFADCVPLIIYDQKQHLMAFAHVGWRSMAISFTQTVLQHLFENEGSKPADLIAVIGPCIKKESYLFRDPIQAKVEAWQPFLVPHHDGRVGIDLVGFCLSECLKNGLQTAQIYVEPMDTAADENQFSHYAGTAGGRPEKQGRLICYGYLE